MVVTSLEPNKSTLFECVSCHYSSCRKSQYTRHILTAKHLRVTQISSEKTFIFDGNNGDDVPSQNIISCVSGLLPIQSSSYTLEPFPKKVPTNKKFECDCGNTYNYRQNLWTHKKKCILSISETIIVETNPIDQLTTVVVDMMKQNQEFKEIIMEQNKQIISLANKTCTTNNMTMNNSNNTNNTKFSLNLFLNETCKDAIDISEFIKLIKYDVPDLEAMGKLGYAEGISQIFMNGLKSIETNKRPIWCSDEKREVMHIRENGSWEKDNEDLSKTKKVISQITKKFHYPLNEWRAKNPSYRDPDNKKSDEYVHMLQQAMGGTKGQDKEYGKIIKRVAKKLMVKKPDGTKNAII